MRTILSILCGAFLVLVVALTFQRCDLWEAKTLDLPCPEISSFSPTGAPFDGTVTVHGRNFLPGSPEFHEIRIGDSVMPDENIEIPDPETILIRIPKGIGNGKISVVIKRMAGCPAVSEREFVYYYTATMVKTIAGTPKNNDASCGSCLNFPSGMDWDAQGRIVVADKSNMVVRKVDTSTGGFITTHGIFRTPECNPGPIINSANANFRFPIDVAADLSGDIYVAEANNNIIRLINSQNNVTVRAGECGNGALSPDTKPCADAKLGVPRALVKEGNILYLVTSGGLRRIDATCLVTPILNSTPNSYTSAIDFSRARPGAGPIFIGDERATVKIKSVTEGGVATDIPFDSAPLDKPADLKVDSKGNIFITDRVKNQLFVLYTNNALVPLAGTGDMDFLDEVAGLSAKFNAPWGLLLNPSETSLYVSDSGNHVIRKITIE